MMRRWQAEDYNDARSRGHDGERVEAGETPTDASTYITVHKGKLGEGGASANSAQHAVD